MELVHDVMPWLPDKLLWVLPGESVQQDGLAGATSNHNRGDVVGVRPLEPGLLGRG